MRLACHLSVRRALPAYSLPWLPEILVVTPSKLSSAHVYLRLPAGLPYGDWDALPPALVMDAAQLVKANSIEGGSRRAQRSLVDDHGGCPQAEG